MTIKPVTMSPQFWLRNSRPILDMKMGFTSFLFLLLAYDSATAKTIYQKIGFARKTDAATQQLKDSVCCLVDDVYNSDLTCLVVSVGGLSLRHCPNTNLRISFKILLTYKGLGFIFLFLHTDTR